MFIPLCVVALLHRDPPHVKITARMNSRPQSFTPNSLVKSARLALTHTLHAHTHTSRSAENTRDIFTENMKKNKVRRVWRSASSYWRWWEPVSSHTLLYTHSLTSQTLKSSRADLQFISSYKWLRFLKISKIWIVLCVLVFILLLLLLLLLSLLI